MSEKTKADKEQNNKYYLFWFGLFGICNIIYQQVQDKWRPNYSGGNEMVQYFLGVAPNYLPGIGLPAFFLILIPFMKPANNNSVWVTHYKHITAILISLSGLILWEIVQSSLPKAVFDVNDVLWTFLGCLTFFIIWHLVPATFRNEK